jgi:tRNA-splicing ligase RtcB
MSIDLVRLSDSAVEIPKTGAMRVPGRIYASESLLEPAKLDEAVQQVRNVAHLPGIVKHSLAMPDFHWGYGFPIGGVAAFDAEEGVVSPGGVGYDINCGVRLVRSDLTLDEVRPKLRDIVNQVFRDIPAGVGQGGAIRTPSKEEGRRMSVMGARWAVEQGFGTDRDLDLIEEGGCLKGADPDAVSARAWERGLSQLGTLGSGNHFLELQVVEAVYRPDVAERLGLALNGIVFAVHSGSRGFGYQVCDDSIGVMMKAAGKYGIHLPDRQLCCAPLSSPEAKRYLGAMCAAANFAFANRQIMMALAQRAIARVIGRGPDHLGFRLIYDLCHNIAKFEEHDVDGVLRRLCVHRKGATRALPPGHPLVPKAYADLGQPVFVPGDMGRASFLLIGNARASKETFASTCHGAGRKHSRGAMKKMMGGRDLFKLLEEKYGVIVRGHSRDGVAEEMPDAYKDAAEVVNVMEHAGISDKVVRLKPLACIKG